MFCLWLSASSPQVWSLAVRNSGAWEVGECEEHRFAENQHGNLAGEVNKRETNKEMPAVWGLHGPCGAWTLGLSLPLVLLYRDCRWFMGF